MKRSPNDIGTHTATAVVRAIRVNGFPGAERRVLYGASDAGDITGASNIIWEVKGGQAAKDASDLTILGWLRKAEGKRERLGADIAVLVVQRAGFGERNAMHWWAVVWASALFELASPSLGGELIFGNFDAPARLLLADMCWLLRLAGHGTPVTRQDADVMALERRVR